MFEISEYFLEKINSFKDKLDEDAVEKNVLECKINSISDLLALNLEDNGSSGYAEFNSSKLNEKIDVITCNIDGVNNDINCN